MRCGASRASSRNCRKMVEAAGIEPASESTPSGRPTCLARAFCRPGADHGQPAPEPSPNGSRPAPSGRHAGPADFFDGTDRRHRLGSGVPRASGRSRRRARAQRCRWRLLRCPSFEEVTCTLCMRSRLRCPRRDRFTPIANPARASCTAASVQHNRAERLVKLPRATSAHIGLSHANC